MAASRKINDAVTRIRVAALRLRAWDFSWRDATRRSHV